MVTDPALDEAVVRDLHGFAAPADAASPAVTFHVGMDVFTAELLRGPGGAFLSNVHTTDQRSSLDTIVATLPRIVIETIRQRPRP
ncbi:MAG: hypothetical protein ABIY55_30705 [Kofleriaceae bacterium]